MCATTCSQVCCKIFTFTHISLIQTRAGHDNHDNKISSTATTCLQITRYAGFERVKCRCKLLIASNMTSQFSTCCYSFLSAGLGHDVSSWSPRIRTIPRGMDQKLSRESATSTTRTAPINSHLIMVLKPRLH